MTNTTTITSCEVCGHSDLRLLLDLGSQPMCDDLIPINQNIESKSYPLRLTGCSNCITVHQEVQVEKTLLFPNSYHYRASLTKDVLDGMEDLVSSVTECCGDVSGKHVLDIGCNDGSLLNIFRKRGAFTCGIEPTDAAHDAKPKVDWLHQGYFDEHAVNKYLEIHKKPDIITFTNVFAHIENLNDLLENIKQLLHEDTKLVIENHYLGAVIASTQFDTFYHEHPRTYSYKSFEVIANRLGKNIEAVEFPSRYSGNIRVIIGNSSNSESPKIDESSFLDAVSAMGKTIDTRREIIHKQLTDLVQEHGPLPAKAFPGRASILIHSLGIDHHIIDATYERPASPKIGHYIPGTKIEIRDETEFFENRIDSPVVINLAWHIQDEITRYLKSEGFKGVVEPLWQ